MSTAASPEFSAPLNSLNEVGSSRCLSAATMLPVSTVLAYDMKKPKDYQAFQRYTVILFRCELKDPNAQEYGRNGQGQSGLDVLGRRNQRIDHYVAVQCRLIAKIDPFSKVLQDCRDAVNLSPNLKEIIFVTTAPDDAKATNNAIKAEQVLHNEGYSVNVTIYGWAALQILISQHPDALAVFDPSSVVVSPPQQDPTIVSLSSDSIAAIAAQFREMTQRGVVAAGADNIELGSDAEDPALHARIDVFRDFFKEGNVLIAKAGLMKIRETAELADRPWAQFRIETNLGVIALELGREAEAAEHFEVAHAARPEHGDARTNLALARICQGRPAEAMTLAQQALTSTPPAAHAVAAVLQAAARSEWEGDPESLIPSDLRATVYADIGLAEFLRFRNLPCWPERNVELASRHPDRKEFKPIAAVAILAMSVDSSRPTAYTKSLKP